MYVYIAMYLCLYIPKDMEVNIYLCISLYLSVQPYSYIFPGADMLFSV